MRRIGTSSRGFMAADAIIALGVVTILATAMVVAVGRHSRASQRLAEQRASIRLAEQTIIALQTGQTPPAPPADMKVSVRKLEAKSDAPAQLAWANVTVTRGSHVTDLTGLVRADAVKGTP